MPEPLYDPDGPPADLDAMSDEDKLRYIDEYLNHPNTVHMQEEMGDLFRASPPEEQLRELRPEATRTEDQLRTVRALLADESNRRVAESLRTLMRGLEDHLDRLRDRIGELEALGRPGAPD